VSDAVARVRERWTAQTGDIIVLGSVSVIRTLFAAGEVDEPELFIVPVALGKGLHCFTADGGPVSLRLQETENWPANVIRSEGAR
jgi:dihydrofolate reductase